MDTGISTLVDLDVPLERLVQLIAAAGFTHLSLSHDVAHAGYHLPSERRRLRAQLDAAGLKLNYIHAPLLRYYDLTSLDGQVRRATLEVMKMVIAACADLGGMGVALHAMNGPLGAGESIAERTAAGLASLAELQAYAEAQRVELGVENLPLDIDCGAVSLSVLRALPPGGLRVCFDSCHALIQRTPAEAKALVEELAPRVRFTHLSDTLGAHDSHLIPGQGAVDYQTVAQALGQAGFDGVVDLECSLWMLRYRMERGTPQPGDPTPEASAALTTAAYLEQAHKAALWIARMIVAARTVEAQG